ncbi:hypothetical protein C0Q44_09525 [Paenibacillus sp. PCH8]|uniref:hypothetical protein n=1 Tax=Paenibacillus sp. PCH8 TaxID=2066524 RepID=UPI000CF8C6FD|nr:hypothetical protein [Paenibacillus sp. PCH8]PQP84747.1 hypothetical protein C0Q44_09525 [Paenibacillus sp. PCH8]
MKKTIILAVTLFMLLLSVAPSTFAAGDRLTTRETFNIAVSPLVSNNLAYALYFTPSGDIQLRNVRSHKILWNTKTKNLNIFQFRIDQYSGKLTLTDIKNTPYWTSDNKAWATAWYGQGNEPENLKGDLLLVQEDGNLVLYNTINLDRGWYPVWASNTTGQ